MYMLFCVFCVQLTAIYEEITPQTFSERGPLGFQSPFGLLLLTLITYGAILASGNSEPGSFIFKRNHRQCEIH